MDEEDDEETESAPQTTIDDDLAFWGLVPDRPVVRHERYFYLWPECVQMWIVFLRCRTQWRRRRVGDHDVLSGLDYPGCELVMERMRIRRRDRDLRFEELQAMEIAAVDESFKRAQRDRG